MNIRLDQFIDMRRAAVLAWVVFATACGGNQSLPSDGGGGFIPPASDSGGGGGGNTVRSCETDKQCVEFNQVCGPRKLCVDCVTVKDCKEGQECLGGRCQTLVKCQSSKDCAASKQVCDTSRTYCVDCMTAADCAPNQLCEDTICVNIPAPADGGQPADGAIPDNNTPDVSQPCQSDRDCPVPLVCNINAGMCESKRGPPCASDRDCAPGVKCLPTGFCDGAGANEGKKCSSDKDCETNQYCGARGTCSPQVCIPRTTRCEGNTKVTCNDNGAGEVRLDCLPTESCLGDRCVSNQCTPTAVICDGTLIKRCRSSGAGFETIQDCAPNGICQNGQCIARVCSPGAERCDGKIIFKCLPDGSGESIVRTCSATENCEAGRCVPAGCTPQCSGRQCGPDGCGGSCGTCTGGKTCNGSGVCVNPPSSCGTCAAKTVCMDNQCSSSSCVPSCKDKTCGHDGCGGTCGGCSSQLVCDGSKCVQPTTCVDDAGCSSSAVSTKCKGGFCRSCAVDTDCSSGRCASGRCIPNDACGGCPGLMTCNSATRRCVGDPCGGCPSGQFCGITKVGGIFGLAESYGCMSERQGCTRTSCISDTDCASVSGSNKCYAGYCCAPGSDGAACTDQSQCGIGMHCTGLGPLTGQGLCRSVCTTLGASCSNGGKCCETGLFQKKLVCGLEGGLLGCE